MIKINHRVIRYRCHKLRNFATKWDLNHPNTYLDHSIQNYFALFSSYLICLQYFPFFITILPEIPYNHSDSGWILQKMSCLKSDQPNILTYSRTLQNKAQ